MDQIVDYQTVLLHNVWCAAGFIGTFCIALFPTTLSYVNCLTVF